VVLLSAPRQTNHVAVLVNGVSGMFSYEVHAAGQAISEHDRESVR
jgi:hypothetical protein